MDQTRVRTYGNTTVINTTERYTLTLEDQEVPEGKRNQMIWVTPHKE